MGVKADSSETRAPGARPQGGGGIREASRPVPPAPGRTLGFGNAASVLFSFLFFLFPTPTAAEVPRGREAALPRVRSAPFRPAARASSAYPAASPRGRLSTDSAWPRRGAGLSRPGAALRSHRARRRVLPAGVPRPPGVGAAGPPRLTRPGAGPRGPRRASGPEPRGGAPPAPGKAGARATSAPRRPAVSEAARARWGRQAEGKRGASNGTPCKTGETSPNRTVAFQAWATLRRRASAQDSHLTALRLFSLGHQVG